MSEQKPKTYAEAMKERFPHLTIEQVLERAIQDRKVREEINREEGLNEEQGEEA
jgi:hypothetical protein